MPARFRNFTVITRNAHLLSLIPTIAEACLSPCEFAWYSTRVPFISPAGRHAAPTRRAHRSVSGNSSEILQVTRLQRDFLSKTEIERQLPIVRVIFPSFPFLETVFSLNDEIEGDLRAKLRQSGMFSKLNVAEW